MTFNWFWEIDVLMAVSQAALWDSQCLINLSLITKSFSSKRCLLKILNNIKQFLFCKQKNYIFITGFYYWINMTFRQVYSLFPKCKLLQAHTVRGTARNSGVPEKYIYNLIYYVSEGPCKVRGLPNLPGSSCPYCPPDHTNSCTMAFFSKRKWMEGNQLIKN